MFETVKKNLEGRGFKVRTFATGAEAADYIAGEVKDTTVAIGGSETVKEIGLFDKLAEHNEVFWHWACETVDKKKALTTPVYIMSANGISETGEIINIDGTGNRAAGMLYGHDKLYIVAGKNKLAPTFEEALWRARNIASPKNAQRLRKKTPCAEKADKCYDCRSEERICRGLVVLWQPCKGTDTEIVLVDEELGY